MAFRREATIRKAEKYVAKGKIESAIDEYRKVLANTPTDVNTLNRVGDLYARIERFDEAVRLFTQIAEQYRREGFFVKAIAIYKKIIKLDPSSLPVYEKLAELYAEQGLVTEARAQFQVLADYYQKHDNAASAITIYQRMAELEPENPTFQLKLAELFASRRLVDKALAAYSRLADIFLVDGSIDEAAKVYLEALEVSADDLDFTGRAVRGLFEAGNRPAAERVLKRAIELNPESEFLGARIGLVGSETEAPEAPLDVTFAVGDEPSTDAETAADDEPATRADADTDAEADADGGTDGDGDAFHLELDIEELETGDAIDLGDLDVELADGDDAPAIDLTFDAETEDAAPEGETEPRDPARAAELIAQAEAAAAESDDVFVFEIDLDDDEIPDSQVAPPSDMIDRPIGVLGGEDEADIVEAAEEAEAALEGEAAVEVEALADDDSVGEDEALELELVDDALETPSLETIDVETLDPDAPATEPEPPIEIDWSLDPELGEESAEEALEASAEQEVVEATADAVEPAPEPEVDASEPEAAASEADELEVFEIGPIDDDSVDIELDIEALTALAADDASVVVPEPEAPTVAATPLSAVRREEDLLAEAQVFAKYGLREKAEERLRELWNLNPDNLEGLALKTRLLLEDGDHEAVMAEANSLAEAGERLGSESMWQALSAHLAEVGYGVDGGRVVSLPGATADGDRISQFLEVLDRGAAAPTEAEPEVASEEPQIPSDEALTGEIDSALDSFFEKQPSASAPAGVDDVRPPVAASATESAPAEAADASADVDVLDESGMSWLEEGPPEAGAEPAAEQEPIFEEDDGFFDLAAEIERELEEEESAAATAASSPKEPSLEEIVEGFKRGVAEHLSPEDYDTHFNLGIAYREMGLLDEAIGEFQLASKDARYLAESSSMLGMSFVEKGLPDLAIKWYRKGLAAPDLEENAMLGLLYDMAAAFEQSGDEEAAQQTWVELYGINSTYRDIASRVSSAGA